MDKILNKPIGFVDIKGYEGLYAINQSGDVYSYPKQVNRNKNGIIKKSHKNEYITTGLHKNKIRKTAMIHILLMETFNPSEDPLKKFINHKNGNKHDNNLENLEWVTAKENSIHAYENGLMSGERGTYVNCGLCKKKIWVYQCKLRASNNVFCSKPCSDKFQQIHPNSGSFRYRIPTSKLHKLEKAFEIKR